MKVSLIHPVGIELFVHGKVQTEELEKSLKSQGVREISQQETDDVDAKVTGRDAPINLVDSVGPRQQQTQDRAVIKDAKSGVWVKPEGSIRVRKTSLQ